MEITFAVLLWGVRIAFLVLLYLFLIRVFTSLQRSLATENAVAARPTGIAHLVVQRTVRGAPRVGDRLPLRAVNARPMRSIARRLARRSIHPAAPTPRAAHNHPASRRGRRRAN
jgi:hypothetical protein